MAQWLRFSHENIVGIGILDSGTITIYSGDLFDAPTATGQTLKLADVDILTPCDPTKVVAMWNNNLSLANKLGLSKPEHPLYLLKGPNTFLAAGQPIKQPPSYDGRVVYEAELGVVISKTCSNVTEKAATDYIFGYTCFNDVTALSLLNTDPTFPQWARAKGFDTFGVFGPVIDTQIDPNGLTVRAELNGRERQNYPISELFYSPRELVSHISRNMTLMPGDIIACGTGPGALPMKPGMTIDVIIDPIGRLSNPFE
jgi:2-keto-4-pentenoate hydratase/2-oxohepta-3-ene-1,7-dioic acid hydratase in catechol pathway